MEKAQFVEFLLMANQAGYADPNAQVTNHPDGGHEITYSQNDMLFTDYWYGGNPFAGQEAVAQGGKTIWAMQYRGGVPATVIVSHDEIFAFLKNALSQCSLEEPLRGPAEFTEGDWRYTNQWSHNLSDFTGHEEITFEGKIVHITEYMGGLVDGGIFSEE